jgi:lipopolysaccharide biosynthesis protein
MSLNRLIFYFNRKHWRKRSKAATILLNIIFSFFDKMGIVWQTGRASLAIYTIY